MAEFPRFSTKRNTPFQKVLSQRVDAYFQKNNISREADAGLKWKALAVFAMYLVPFGLIMFVPMHFALSWVLWLLMGLGMAAIGMNVMHDALHGSWSKNSLVNRLMGDSIYLLCGNPFTWKVQHNYLHHTFTNIKGLDEDVEVRGLMRLHEEEPWKPWFRHQHLYGPILYSLLTLNWAVTKDFTQMRRYWKKGLLKKFNQTLSTQMVKLVLGKLIYFSFILLLPLLIAPQAWWAIVLGWLFMHFTGGFVLSAVFQLAHVVDDAEQYGWSGEDIETNWMEHQLRTTSNFATSKRIVTWFTGGLNHQVEHHLFPYISHAHYPALSGIVQQTAAEYGLPYYNEPRMRKALGNHFRTLKELGKAA